MPKSFRELKVWQAAMELALSTYDLTSLFPKHEIYGLSAQVLRAAVSIASNLAEGSARSTRRDFRHFVLIARGSNAELPTQILLAMRLGYATEQKLTGAERLAGDVGRMLHGLASLLKQRPEPPTL